jgi:hypothetical protein
VVKTNYNNPSIYCRGDRHRLRILAKPSLGDIFFGEILHEGLAEGEARGLIKGKARGLAEGKAEGLAKGKAKGLAEATNQIALNMLRSSISVDVVAQLTGLTAKQVQKLQKMSNKKSQKPKN